MELTEILRRKEAGQSISEIADNMKRDRKTVRKYLKLLIPEEPNEDGTNKATIPLCRIIEKNKKERKKQTVFTPYKHIIISLLEKKENRLKIKSVYEVISKKYELEGASSLSSFKRFLKEEEIDRGKEKVTCRIERKPGEEVQVDYAKMGKLIDPVTKVSRAVYAFIATLACSKHKYVEFVYRQDQASFAESHIKMLKWFNGVPRTVTIDNLKTGVIKPDLYDPLLNKTYCELATHYKFFINPARIVKPKDKPSVERDVQTVREEFRKMLSLNPDISLREANRQMSDWLVNVYGKRKHGTTQEYPYEFFTEIEHPCLLPLPAEEYEIVTWKEVKVHPDCFIQVNKKAYSVPYLYVGKTLMVKVKTKTVEIYYRENLIKEHYIPKNFRQTDYGDFPENIRKAIDEKLPAYLQNEAMKISGENLSLFIRALLIPHAFINIRRAQGIISLAKKYDNKYVEAAAIIALDNLPGVHPKFFEQIITGLINRDAFNQTEEITISEETLSFIRPDNYFNSQSLVNN